MGLKETFGELALKASVHKADLFFGGGIAFMGVGSFFIGWGTLRAKKAVDARKNKLDSIEQAEECTLYSSEDDKKSELVKANAETAGKIALAYSPAAACMIAGVALLTSAHIQQKNGLIAMTALYNTTLAAFNEYREHVRNDQGAEKDALYLNRAEEVTVEETVATKKGHEKIVSKTELHPVGVEDVYHRIFDARCTEWENPNHMPGYNSSFVRLTRERAQQLFDARGYLLYTEVCELFGMDYKKFGGDVLLLGWHKNAPMNDGFIDFGIDMYKCDWIETSDGDVWMEFNCDGDIREWL